MIQDIKRKVRWYKSDFTDCLSLQCVASFFFIYFAVLTPIVTFGGLLGDATHSYLVSFWSNDFCLQKWRYAPSSYCIHFLTDLYWPRFKDPKFDSKIS